MFTDIWLYHIRMCFLSLGICIDLSTVIVPEHSIMRRTMSVGNTFGII